MELTITLIYKCVQGTALFFLAAWLLLGGRRGIGSVCRSLALLLSIAAPILLYLSVQKKLSRLLLIYLGVSAAVFLIFGLDKLFAVKGRKGSFRFPENVLLLLSLIGVFGSIAGMLVFHHKNKKAKLQYAVPGIALIEMILLYVPVLKNRTLPISDWKSFDLFHWLTMVTTAVLCLMLIKTFILVRLLVMLPISAAAALFSVRLFCRMGTSVTVSEIIKEKPIPFFAVAAAVFLILEVISVECRFITSVNEVRKKTDHSKQPEK